MATATPTRFNIASRTFAAILGGYAFTWGLAAFGTAAMVAADVEFHDAEHLSAIIGFLVFLIIFLTAFGAANIKRVWLVLVGGALVLTLGASLIQSQIA